MEILSRLWAKMSRLPNFTVEHSPQHLRRIHNNVPYFSQWESRELVGQFVNEQLSAREDPKWKDSGATTKEEYELWSWNGCGMACLKMILAYRLNKIIPIVELGRSCQKFGGYIARNNSLDGLYYRPFLTFIKSEFNLSGRIISPMSIQDAVRELEQDRIIIASVSHEIRDPRSIPSKKGGHLVLVLGYDLTTNSLFMHNPSGDTPQAQELFEITFVDFEKFFAHRGVVIY